MQPNFSRCGRAESFVSCRLFMPAGRTFTGWWCAISLLSLLVIDTGRQSILQAAEPGNLPSLEPSPPKQRTISPIDGPQMRWPRAFNTVKSGTRKTPSQSKPEPPRLSNLLAEEMARTYWYCIGQETSIELLVDKFPQLGKQLLAAQSEFDLKFKPAITTIDRVLIEKNRPWAGQKETSLANLRKQINLKDITLDQAQAYVAEIHKRARGEMPSPILETLLMFHPTYIREPAEEYLAGYKREYRSDGSGKAKGVKFGIEYPMSWKADESRRPNIVKKFVSENGRGLEIVSLLVLETPASARSPATAKDVEEIRQARIWESVAVGSKTLDSGTVRLLGQPAIWGEYTWRTNQAGIDLELHGFDLMFLYESRLVGVSFQNTISPHNSNETAEQKFERYAPLFQLMISSIDVFNRYEK